MYITIAETSKTFSFFPGRSMYEITWCQKTMTLTWDTGGL